MKNSSNNRRLWLFILATCLVSWAFAGFMYLIDAKDNAIVYTICGAVYMLFPAIAAFLLQKAVFKEPIKKPFLISFKLNWWFAAALLTPIVVMLLSLGISLLLPGVEFSSSAEGLIERYASTLSGEQLAVVEKQLQSISPIAMLALTLVQGIIAACTVNALFAFGEELGWRGYMLYYLRNCSLLKASLVIGFVWGLWHFPLILMGHNYPDHPIAGVFMMIILCVLMTPMMIYIVLKSKSVLTAAIFHGSTNAIAGFPLIYLNGGSDLSDGMTGYAGFIALALITVCFFVFDKFVAKENIFTKTIKISTENE